MTSAPTKSIAFQKKSKDIDSIKWATTTKLLLDIVFLLKYLRQNTSSSNFPNNTDTTAKTVEKHYISRRPMFSGANPRNRMVSSSVKYASNYRASRLAHYQDQVHDDSTNRGSFRPSRRSSNLSGYSINSLYGATVLPSVVDRSHDIPTGDDDINNNGKKTISDELPVNVYRKVTNITESRGDTRRKSSNNDNALNVRSQSSGPTSNLQNRNVLTSIRNRSNPDTTELTHLRSTGESVVRNNPNSKPCYFCWCCCCSCSCLNIKPKPDESVHTRISNEPHSKLDTITNDDRFTIEEAQKWALNFEFLMQSTGGRKIFHEFLKLEYSEENIMFYKAVEELHTESNHSLIEEKARSIYEDYISILSPKEVSLDSRVRELINSDMVEPSSHTFDEAQLQIFTLMQRDSYPRFLNSRLYKDILRQLGGSSTTSNSQTLSEPRPINNI